MARRRSWGTGSGSLVSAKVIDFLAYRRSRNLRGSRTVFYINDNARWSSKLGEIAQLRVIDIRSLETLSERLLTAAPELILMESDLTWTDPVRLARTLSELSESPIVLLCPAEKTKNLSGLLKRAYAAGVSDTLYAPLSADELLETMDVLVKFQYA